uniref:Nucleocapsid protein n=1 Tax=Beihai orthomyxo-like virus 1 TaxID=1922494 RepID=A0A1L3KKK7_9VIRU|nr:nucleocapsid protein [Beihai orthomyxo-like virus 1]
MAEGGQDIEMATAESAPKKMRVDMDGNEVTRRNRVGVTGITADSKKRAHKYVSQLYKGVEESFNVGGEEKKDVLLSVLVFKQCLSVHNAYRQKITATGSRYNKFNSSATVTFKYRTMTYSSTPTKLIEAVVKALKSAGYTWNNSQEPWLGNVQMIMALWGLFGERLTECRLGSDEMIVSKDNSGTKVRTLSEYGIAPGFRHLASGINWSLPVQAALAQSLGPLAIAIQLSNNMNVQYRRKWQAAFNRVFSHVPNFEAIGRYLAENPPQMCKAVLAELARIIAVLGGRQQERISFPPCILADLNDIEVEDMNFSGIAGQKLYNKKVAKSTYANIDKAHAGIISGILFNSCFGTAGEDFGVLSGITTHKTWYTRAECQGLFSKMKPSNEDGTLELINMPELKVFSKMSGASQTKLITTGSEPVSSKMMFSGFRVRHVSEVLLECLKGEDKFQRTGMSTGEILNGLREVREMLLEKIDNNFKAYQAGTVQWITEDGRVVDDVLREIGRNYWSN